jgi:hypothetical protein
MTNQVINTTNSQDQINFDIDSRLAELGLDAVNSPSNVDGLSIEELDNRARELKHNIPNRPTEITTSMVMGSTNPTEWPTPHDFETTGKVAKHYINQIGSEKLSSVSIVKAIVAASIGGARNTVDGAAKATAYAAWLRDVADKLENAVAEHEKHNVKLEEYNAAKSAALEAQRIVDEQVAYNKQFTQAHRNVMDQIKINDELTKKMETMEKSFLNKVKSLTKQLTGK